MLKVEGRAITSTSIGLFLSNINTNPIMYDSLTIQSCAIVLIDCSVQKDGNFDIYVLMKQTLLYMFHTQIYYICYILDN